MPWGLVLLPVCLAVWLAQELSRDRWRRAQTFRARKAFVFSLVTAFAFAFWEGALRFLFGQSHDAWGWAGVALCLVAVARRRGAGAFNARLAISRTDWILLWCAWSLGLGAWMSFALFSPWLWIRQRSSTL